MRVEIGWKTEGYTEAYLTDREVQLALSLGAKPDDAYSIIEALAKSGRGFMHDIIEEFYERTSEFVSAVELTEEEA